MRRITTVALAAGVFLVPACGNDSQSTDDLTVFAAASLTEAFMAIGDAFGAEYPDADITFNFASSSDLARQIVEGAPADVYASADPINMEKVTAGGTATDQPVVFATNRAEIIVASGNPLGLTGVDDLATQDLVVVVCAPEVPCGTYADEIFANAGIEVTPDSFEENVKAVVTKVTLGEADAGIVYATDVRAAAGDAGGVVLPDDLNVIAEYPIVVTSDAGRATMAQLFIDFVLGPAGRQILESYGFGTP